MSNVRRRRKRHRRDDENDVKDRLIQTRVPSKLESALKEEAKKRRLTVSHLIRNMLEDTLELVDTVVTGVDDIARSSAGLAEQVARDAGKIAAVARESFRRPDDAGESVSETAARAPRAADAAAKSESPPRERSEAPPAPALDAVLAWNPVVVNKPTTCMSCTRELPRGTHAFLGIAADPTAPPTWLCDGCTEKLRSGNDL